MVIRKRNMSISSHKKKLEFGNLCNLNVSRIVNKAINI